METGFDFSKLFLVIATTTLFLVNNNAVSGTAVCEYSVVDRNKLYNYSLASPSPKFPHGVLSEDGFYKVAVNETVLWFQLCDGMIFNHGPPKCVDCLDCGGPTRCGMECSALVADNIGGYSVCTTVGHATSIGINVIDKKNPHMGVVVKMSSSNLKHNCSLSVSVICESNGVQGPHSLEKSGTCNYYNIIVGDAFVGLLLVYVTVKESVMTSWISAFVATVIRHPLGCAKIESFHGKGWGWFVTFITIMFCILGGYFLAGTVYRFFVLGVRGIDVIPNLQFWTNAPHRTQSFFVSSVRKFRGPSQGHRSSYSPVNF